MKWNSNENRLEMAALTTETYDQQILELVESLGDWIEAGNPYRDYFPEKSLNFLVEPEQIGLALATFATEWAGDIETVTAQMSGLEINVMCYYIALRISLLQQRAASASHKGEADEALFDNGANSE